MTRTPLALALAAAVALACGSDADRGATGDSTSTSVSMNPGRDCTQCHAFTLAGTVYAVASPPAGSAGATGALVHVTDAAGAFTLESDQQGSFYTTRPITPPVSVSIDLGGASASMSGIGYTRGSQVGCASCHGATRAVVHVP
jgi:hypothetical protein